MIPGYYPISITQFLSALSHINNHFRILYSKAQSVQRNITSVVPTADTLGEKEEVYYINGAIVRKYVKLNGSIYYCDLTTV